MEGFTFLFMVVVTPIGLMLNKIGLAFDRYVERKIGKINFSDFWHGLSNERGKINIYLNGIWINASASFLSKGWMVRFKDVREITFLQKKNFWGKTVTYLEVHLRDRRKQRIRISSDERALRKCLWALCRISHFVDVKLGIKRKSEASFARMLKSRYETNFTFLPDEERMQILRSRME